MKPHAIAAAAAILVASFAFSQSEQAPVVPGSPLPGITPAELELFRAGLDDFTEVEFAEDGLGPTFNGNSCAVCHSVPAIGGFSTMTEIRAGRRDEEGSFYPLLGGTLYHLFSVPTHRCQVQIPEEANVIARRAVLPIFGDGLVEAIADETIAAQADPTDANGDGISGKAAWITEVTTGSRRVGRFGWKAQQATLLGFSADAYLNEMGITNDFFPKETALGISDEQMKECGMTGKNEDVADRRTGVRAIDLFAGFMRFLAPVDRGPIDDSVKRGDVLFRSVGCASCHTPVLMTAPNANPVFDRKPVNLYSDLLLHDIGTGDGIEQEAASPEEVRTPPLWGLRFRRPFMRDGGSMTISDAILRHQNEASAVTAKFVELSNDQKRDLLAFLNSL